MHDTAKEWPVIKPVAYQKTPQQYVICLDTMGQDREFTVEQRRFVIETVIAFRDAWERSEMRVMDSDVEVMMELQGRDREKIKEENNVALEKIEEEVNSNMAPKIELGFKDENIKELETNNVRLKQISKSFGTVSLWEYEMITKIVSLRVIKMPRIIHALMSFLGYERENICEPETNLFSWKLSKKEFGEHIRAKMRHYNPLGVMQDNIRFTKTINFAEKLLQGYNQEDVDTYHPGFGRMY